ncbi:MAG: hypothetical protein QOH26_54 [Actinomycetota bacterium]|jgi:hypothetical protein|nr:hypothetical protein [Actinomycetota bacterium]
MLLPGARGPLTELLFSNLVTEPHAWRTPLTFDGDPLSGDDFHLALYCCYELHYRGFDDVDERWEWNPSLLAFRAALEERFEAALFGAVDRDAGSSSVTAHLIELAGSDGGPSLARYLETRGTAAQFIEFMIHRSAYQLKEADPHSWAIPRLEGPPKAALLEIQTDEYGGGDPERIHAVLFARSMGAVGLDASYGAYLDALPGATLATVNLMSFFGLHRRWRGAIVGHLALFEMTSTEPNRRYGNGLRRLGFGEDATFFFDEHVEADSVHEQIAAHDLGGGLARQDPTLTADIIFGARSLLFLEDRWTRHLLDSWSSDRSSLLGSDRVPLRA